MFDDRTDAGERLAAELESRGLEADIVLGIPRGALPVARPVADALDADLDVVVARKMGAPKNPELALGAVASDGSVWYNEDLIDRLGVSDEYLEEIRGEEANNAREKADRYRETVGLPDLQGKRVIVVDDGVATGATAMACLRQIRNSGAAFVALAVPVGSPRGIGDLETEADEIIALRTPQSFRAVGQFYRTFGQVSDEEAVGYLERERTE
ncbi:phosphoribosyltransferase [Natronorubrum halophilum]|uniref:phosphoribosyltransferase n=1 Tax=Natronorubrum halophilum TaxID=1702106 RepID=UPI000EF73D5F|nr:phosphoribosyltransferase family protein [Natronorubrum halophilum]